MITLRDTRAIDDLAARDIPVVLKPNSALAKIVTPYINAEVGSIEELVELINADTNHEGIVEELGKQLAGVMTDKISFIRNTVGALIEEMTDNVERRLANLKAFPLPVEVVTRRVPQFFLDGTLAERIDVIKDREYNSQSYKSKMSAITAQDIAQAFSNKYDGELLAGLNQLIAMLPVSVEAIYEKRFMGKTPEKYPAHFELVPGAHIEFRHVEAAIAFFLTDALPDSEAVNNFTLPVNEFNETIDTVQIEAAKQLAGTLSQLEMEEKSEKVFIKINQTVSPTRYILTEPMSEALVSNYGQDTLVGLAIIQGTNSVIHADYGESSFTLNNELQVRAKDAYAREFKLQEMKSKQHRRSQQVVQTILAFEEALNSNDTIDVPDGMTKVELLDTLRKEISAHMDCDPEKITDGIRRVVTNGIYPDSGAAEFLAALDSFGDITGTPREGATLAATELYAKWAVNQLL